MHKMLLALILAICSTNLNAQEHQWFLAGNAGYDFPLGNGLLWTTYGNASPFSSSPTYFERDTTPRGNSGVHLELELGYEFTPDFSLSLDAIAMYETSTLESAYSYYTNGSVAQNWDDEFHYGSTRVGPHARYRFFHVGSWSLFGGLTPTVVIPASLTMTANTPMANYQTDTMYYNVGWGVGAEIGGEYRFNDHFGFMVSVSMEKITLPRKEEEYRDSDGVLYTYQYQNRPKTNSNHQTASDVARSTSSHYYYTEPAVSDDMSDFGIKAGLVWYF